MLVEQWQSFVASRAVATCRILTVAVKNIPGPQTVTDAALLNEVQPQVHPDPKAAPTPDLEDRRKDLDSSGLASK